MRVRHLPAVPLLLALFALFAPAASHARVPSAWLPAPAEFFSEFRAERFSTDQFRDDSGDKGPMPGDFLIERRALTWYNEIGWRERFAVVFGVPLESRTQRFGLGVPPAPDYVEATQTGLGDLLLGVRWGLMRGAHRAFSIEADWEAPLGYDRKASPELGDGLQKLVGHALFGAAPAWNGFFQLDGGMRFLFDDSIELEAFWGGDASLWTGSRLLITGVYEGRMEMDDAPDDPAASSHVVGPQVLLRVDDRLDVFAGSRHTLAGQNVIDVNAFYVGMAFKKTGLNRLQGFLGGTAGP